MNRIRLCLAASVLLCVPAISATRTDDAPGVDFNLPSEPGAIRLDGGETRMVVPHSEALSLEGAMTIELWVRPKMKVVNKPWHPNLIGKRKENTAYPSWALGLGANLEPYTVADDEWHYDERQLKPGNWAHVAMVFDGAAVRFFINGVPGKPHPAKQLGPENDEPVILGTLLNNTQNFCGDIGPVRVSNRARYEGRFRPTTSWSPDPSTALLLDFRDRKTLSRDRSHNANHGKTEGELERVALAPAERLELELAEAEQAEQEPEKDEEPPAPPVELDGEG